MIFKNTTNRKEYQRTGTNMAIAKRDASNGKKVIAESISKGPTNRGSVKNSNTGVSKSTIIEAMIVTVSAKTSNLP